MKKKLVTKEVRELAAGDKPIEIWDSELGGFLVRVQPTGAKTFYCSLRLKSGKKTRVKIGSADVFSTSDARNEARKVLGDVLRGKDPNAERKRSRSGTLGAFLENAYRPLVLDHKKSGHLTLMRIRACFGSFLNVALDDLSGWNLERWRSERKRDGISTATINRDIVAIKAALSKAVEWGMIQVHPFTKVKPLKVDNLGVVRFLTAEEALRLRKALSDRDNLARMKRISGNEWRVERHYPVMNSIKIGDFSDHLTPMTLLALNTGLRRGELFELSWSAVSFEHRRVTVTAGSSKSGESRHVPLNVEATETLRTWWNQSGSPEAGLVFPAQRNKKFNNVRNSWIALLKKANIEGFRFHDLRHDFASRLVMAGIDLNTVRELLGHADIKMTLRYSHLSPTFKAAAVARLDRPIVEKIELLDNTANYRRR